MRIKYTIIKPLINEKSVALATENRYMFKVDLNATKGAVSNRIHELFNVDVIKVRTAVLPGKPKRVLKTRKFTKTNKWKKAIVEIKEGQKIDLFPKE